MKIYLILEFDIADKCRVHSAYLYKEKAEERCFHLTKQNLVESVSKTYHVIKKTLKGNIIKAIKKGIVK